MKKNIIAFSFMLCGFIVGACSYTASATQDYPITIWKHNDNGAYETLCVIDKKTNVNYIVVAMEVGNGHRSIAITPRLNLDGSLYFE